MKVGFIREVTDTTWLANVVMVKKLNNQWRMCTVFNDLNKVCPKDVVKTSTSVPNRIK